MMSCVIRIREQRHGVNSGNNHKTWETVEGDPGFDPWIRKIPWRTKREPTPVCLPPVFHGQRSLVDSSPWGHKKDAFLQRDGP
ncbi:hypothetical protein CapIbe_007570 [Capra ibex]